MAERILRVRLVFRVHIPQPSGKVLSLQTASIPVECCKSACDAVLNFVYKRSFSVLFIMLRSKVN